MEDQDYNIVRFNGTYYSRPGTNFYLHFDSWRLNLRPGMWLPAYIYSEESELKYRMNKSLHFRAQTRLWGYDLKALNKNSEFTQILVDSPQSVKDQTEVGADATPVVAERMWERQAEDNAVERLQKIGLLAPPGEVDKILQTVVNNLLVTNNIDLQGDIRCRVLLTSPLESFTIGHTIVISRGLLERAARSKVFARHGFGRMNSSHHSAGPPVRYQAGIQRPHVLPRRRFVPAPRLQTRAVEPSLRKLRIRRRSNCSEILLIKTSWEAPDYF